MVVVGDSDSREQTGHVFLLLVPSPLSMCSLPSCGAMEEEERPTLVSRSLYVGWTGEI